MEAMWFLLGFVLVGAALGWMIGSTWSWLVVFGLFSFCFYILRKKSLVGIALLSR